MLARLGQQDINLPHSRNERQASRQRRCGQPRHARSTSTTTTTTTSRITSTQLSTQYKPTSHRHVDGLVAALKSVIRRCPFFNRYSRLSLSQKQSSNKSGLIPDAPAGGSTLSRLDFPPLAKTNNPANKHTGAVRAPDKRKTYPK